MALKIRKQIEVGFNPAVNSSIARCNFHFSSVAGIILCFLPTENTLFKGHPYAFYACVVSVVFTFTGSFSALMIGDNSKISRFCTLYSFVAMVLALSCLAYILLV
ncbi:hypothetical protein EPI10_017750 [Gossypium australe]|uniref:Uncharacterized protein n=1 Tax=Gossypium australe TaxID=47621 RepID=A0A5B6UEP7_9ROSI|nr:hypothetical protein EPI10_017750 [Gossypium australe]